MTNIFAILVPSKWKNMEWQKFVQRLLHLCTNYPSFLQYLKDYLTVHSHTSHFGKHNWLYESSARYGKYLFNAGVGGFSARGMAPFLGLEDQGSWKKEWGYRAEFFFCSWGSVQSLWAHLGFPWKLVLPVFELLQVLIKRVSFLIIITLILHWRINIYDCSYIC